MKQYVALVEGKVPFDPNIIIIRRKERMQEISK
jgi:hypothetical protein